MVVYRSWIIQEMLEQGMDGGGAQKIRAPHHMGDVLRCVIHHDCQMISRITASARQYNIPNIINKMRCEYHVIFGCFKISGKLLKGNLRVARKRSRHIEPPCGPVISRVAFWRATGARIDRPVGSPNRLHPFLRRRGGLSNIAAAARTTIKKPAV